MSMWLFNIIYWYFIIIFTYVIHYYTSPSAHACVCVTMRLWYMCVCVCEIHSDIYINIRPPLKAVHVHNSIRDMRHTASLPGVQLCDWGQHNKGWWRQLICHWAAAKWSLPGTLRHRSCRPQLAGNPQQPVQSPSPQNQTSASSASGAHVTQIPSVHLSTHVFPNFGDCSYSANTVRAVLFRL